MNMYEEYERELKSHIVFAYNHLNMGEKSFLGYEFVNKMEDIFSELHEYDHMILALNSKGGNLAAAAKLVQLLRLHYKSYDIIVCTRCSSAATFVAMGARRLICTRNAIVTPAEPQLEWNDKRISITVIRNLLEQKNSVEHLMKNIDWEVLANYFASRNYFKELCLKYLEGERARRVIDYMLNHVSSHQYPITKNELESIGLVVEILEKGKLFNFIKEKDKFLNKKLKGVNTPLKKEQCMHVIMSSKRIEEYVKLYEAERNQYKKVFEGFLEEEKS